MHLLLITHYFPPESNAPANRAFEHARAWLAQGHSVTVVTAAPSHPQGTVYPGYANAFASEELSGIRVLRLPTMLAANRGVVWRSLAFFSFFVAVLRFRRSLPPSDAVISTSPQFFCGLAGWLLRNPHRPWVLEIRDLWPESIVAVGAMRRNIAIRMLEYLERLAYRTADLVVTTTSSHRKHVEELAPHTPVLVIPNGITVGLLDGGMTDAQPLRAELGLYDRFVVAYFGTIGMAHGLETILDAAEILHDDKDIVFLLAGDGAARSALAEQAAARGLSNVVMLGQQPRERMAALWSVADASAVLLRRSETFERVLPSKMIEAMSLAKPVILGVAGEARELLERAGGGIAIPPEDAAALAEAVVRLARDPDLSQRYGRSGRAFARAEFDRRILAERMAAAIGKLKP